MVTRLIAREFCHHDSKPCGSFRLLRIWFRPGASADRPRNLADLSMSAQVDRRRYRAIVQCSFRLRGRNRIGLADVPPPYASEQCANTRAQTIHMDPQPRRNRSSHAVAKRCLARLQRAAELRAAMRACRIRQRVHDAVAGFGLPKRTNIRYSIVARSDWRMGGAMFLVRIGVSETQHHRTPRIELKWPDGSVRDD